MKRVEESNREPIVILPNLGRRFSGVTSTLLQNLSQQITLSSGSPVIARRTGGFELVIRDQVDGSIVDCGDSAQIAAAFSEMASDPVRLAAMSRSSRKRIEESFTIEREARTLVDVYETFSKCEAEEVLRNP